MKCICMFVIYLHTKFHNVSSIVSNPEAEENFRTTAIVFSFLHFTKKKDYLNYCILFRRSIII
jgi:hypothetical protein